MSFSEGKYCKVNRTVFSMENRLFSYRKTNKKKMRLPPLKCKYSLK